MRNSHNHADNHHGRPPHASRPWAWALFGVALLALACNRRPPEETPAPEPVPPVEAKPAPKAPAVPTPNVTDPELGRVYLSDLAEENVRPVPPGWRFGKAGQLGAPGADGEREVRAVGRAFPKALSMHPTNTHSGCKYRIPPSAMFQTLVGLDDSSRGSSGPVVFEVLGDGKSLWKSPPQSKPGEYPDCRVPLKGVAELELRVHPPEGSAFAPTHAHAVWLDPYLVP